jgi:CheY-like chemotaxis protein
MRVLVAEDHERLAGAVAAGLRRYTMVVDVALDGDDALARLGANRYDVVVLDRDLPGTHGDEICRTCRQAVRELGTMSLPCRDVFAHGQASIEVIGPALEDEARSVRDGFWNRTGDG